MPLIGRSNVNKMLERKYTSLNNNVRAIFFNGGYEIIKETPVDEGRTRSNWFFEVGSPSSKVTKSKNDGAGLRELNKMPKFIFNKKLFITNNLPNIIPLEYGGYPNPVKKGTWNKKKKKYEIRSVNGFSKQAPKGWVRAAIIRMRNRIRAL